MTEQEILNNNKFINIEIESYEKIIKMIEDNINKLKKELVPPCKFCHFDGQFRCQACSETNYYGFNIKDFPNNLLSDQECKSDLPTDLDVYNYFTTMTLNNRVKDAARNTMEHFSIYKDFDNYALLNALENHGLSYEFNSLFD